MTSPLPYLLFWIIIATPLAELRAQTPCGRPSCPATYSEHRRKSRHRNRRSETKPAVEESQATLTIVTEPNSEIVINHKRQGSTNESGVFVTSVRPDEKLTIVATKPGYEEGSDSAQLRAREQGSVTIKLKPKPGTLSVIPSISESEIYVSGLGSYKDKIYALTVPPGTYSITVSKFCYRNSSRELTVKPAESWVVDVQLKLLPVDDLLNLVEENWQKQNFDNAVTAARRILDSTPAHPRANLMMGLRLHAIEKFSESTRHLLLALEGGEQIILPISYHSGSDHQGTIFISTERLEFRSSAPDGPAVIVPVNKIYGSETRPRNSYRLRVVVGFPGGKKEDRKNLDFNVIRGLAKNFNCASCGAELELIQSLVTKLMTGRLR